MESIVKIKNKAQAGTLESSDVLITVEPSNDLEIVINSSVKDSFGHLIEETIKETLNKHKIKEGKIILQDKGALNPTLVARLETAIERSM
jgi:citrate lyase subunit gamma (acyl carrier protein)